MPLFEKLLKKARRKVESKTGRGEGRSPELFKADRREPCSLVLSWRLWFMLSLSGLWWFCGPVVHRSLGSWSCGLVLDPVE